MRTSAVSGQFADHPKQPHATESSGGPSRTRAARARKPADRHPADHTSALHTPSDHGPHEHASFTALLNLCARYMLPDDLDILCAAYMTASKAHAGVLRQTGEPYIEHPIAVAAILAELAVDPHGIAAALLHDTVEDTPLTIEQITAEFGPQIAAIVDGVTKFRAVETPKARPPEEAAAPVDAQAARERKARVNAETVHKLFLAMIRDPRVVLLKLADRLHNMRTMAAMSLAQREVKSREVLDIYAPLAGRIGLFTLKGELEDLAFSYLHPVESARTTELLENEADRRGAWAQRMSERMRRELAACGITAAVNWRLKRPYRAWVEAQEVGMDVSLLSDLIAFRVLVSTVSDCYQTLGYIHRLWMPYERIRDYISNRKNNGYQSLHTAIFALDGRLAQIHIRTHRMHRAAQHGVATPWIERAAQGEFLRAGASIPTQTPTWVRQLTSWEDDLKLSAADFVDAIRAEIFQDQVIVFTPKGDVRELPAGATALDLAYLIHTRVGDRAVGAHVKATTPEGVLVSRDVPVHYVLQTGDVVQIVTNANAHPQPEWRYLAVTRYAREKIARALRMLDRGEPASGTPYDDEPAAETDPDARGSLRHPVGKETTLRLAQCCYPCPGDEIAGLVERGGVLTIHRECCRILRATLRRRRTHQQPDAGPAPMRWDDIPPMPYRIYLAIYGQDHLGLMYEVSSRIATLGLSVTHAVARANPDRYKAAITLTLEMSPKIQRELVIRRLRTVPGVTHVERDLRKGCDEAQS